MKLHPYYHYSLYQHIRNRDERNGAIAYLVSGALISGSDYATFTAITLLGGDLLVATVVAYIVGLTVSYLLNRYWVFRKKASEQSGTTNLTRYAIFLLVNLGITYGMLWAMEHGLGISPFIGKFVVNAFMIPWIYLGDRYWVFRGEKMGPIQL